MKTKQKSLLFLGIIPLLLTACNGEKKCFCLDTSNAYNYQEGYCYQMSRKDVVETFYLCCAPYKDKTPDDEDYYEITWKKKYSFEHFTFIGGLQGKKIKGVVLLENNTLRINVSNSCIDQEATSGYLRISPEAYDSHSPKSKDAFLYAYIAIGEKSDLVIKPEDVSF